MIPLPIIALGAAVAAGTRYFINKHQKSTENSTLAALLYSIGVQIDPNKDIDLNVHLENGNPIIVEALIKSNIDLVEYLISKQVDINAMTPDGKTAIFYAQDIHTLDMLIQAGAKVDARDIHGRTSLFYAPSNSIVEFLLNHHINPNIRDDDGKSALFYADNTTAIDTLIQHGADVNQCDNCGKTPLFYAHNLIIFKHLIKNDADLLIQDNEGKTLLFYIPQHKYVLFKSLIDIAPVIQNIRDHQGNLPIIPSLKISDKDQHRYNDQLDHAIEAKDLALAEKALEAGADPCGESHTLENSNMLKAAVINKCPEMVNLLISYGADVNESLGSQTCIQTAIIEKQIPCIRILLKHNARITHQDLSYAEMTNNAQIKAMIREALHKNMPEDDLQAEDSYAQQYLNAELHRTIIWGSLNSIQHQIDLGGDPNGCVYEYGSTQSMLIVAIENNRLMTDSIIRLLVRNGADVNLMVNHRTPLMVACMKNDFESTQTLLELGATITDTEKFYFKENKRLKALAIRLGKMSD